MLLASAPTLEAARAAVVAFYCGESKTLVPVSGDEWRVIGTYSGKPVEVVRVVRKRGRFRFEATP